MFYFLSFFHFLFSGSWSTLFLCEFITVYGIQKQQKGKKRIKVRRVKECPNVQEPPPWPSKYNGRSTFQRGAEEPSSLHHHVPNAFVPNFFNIKQRYSCTWIFMPFLLYLFHGKINKNIIFYLSPLYVKRNLNSSRKKN